MEAGLPVDHNRGVFVEFPLFNSHIDPDNILPDDATSPDV